MSFQKHDAHQRTLNHLNKDSEDNKQQMKETINDDLSVTLIFNGVTYKRKPNLGGFFTATGNYMGKPRYIGCFKTLKDAVRAEIIFRENIHYFGKEHDTKEAIMKTREHVKN